MQSTNLIQSKEIKYKDISWDFRNITIRDEKTDFPTSRIWFSMFKNNGDPFLNVSESKYLNNSWETVNNIVIPPECVEELLTVLDVLKDQLKSFQKTTK